MDLCCGTGRHVRALGVCGYRVTGVDRSSFALAEAELQMGDPNITYCEQDMRNLQGVPGSFEAILCLWQSFGYFDEATNKDILRQIGQKLEPGGRLLLDLYNREFFENHLEPRSFVKNGVPVNERKTMDENRLTVSLTYGDGAADTFDWRLYTPEDLCEAAEEHGFEDLLSCADFDERELPSPEKPRMQLVFEKLA